MQVPTKLPFSTLVLMISFASVNAVLFTPALPDITRFFSISTDVAQYTITWFLVGYALGQLIYGPLANRFGRKPALYVGIGLQIASSLLCVFSGMIHAYSILVLSRFLLAIGSGVGLKMTFTLVNECYEPRIASQKISYLILAFAITPGLGVAIGGILNTYYGWTSCFYAGALYGLLLLFLVARLPETQSVLDHNALKLRNLVHEYGVQFKNSRLIGGGSLMGIAGSFVYLFAAVAPFLAINFFGMNSAQYGSANMLPPIGMVLGSLFSARLAKAYSLEFIIRIGIGVSTIGVIVMLIAVLTHLSVWLSLFLPMIIIYFGLTPILANASTMAMSNVTDKSHGSAVMNFINVGLMTIAVFSLSFFSVTKMLLPYFYLFLCVMQIGLYGWLVRK